MENSNSIQALIQIPSFNRMSATFQMKIIQEDSKPAVIQPITHSNKESQITVRPRNRLSSMFEIIEPPRITKIIHPLEDAYTRDQAGYTTINYGESSSLLVGKDITGYYRSYLKFDPLSIGNRLVIESAKLRLFTDFNTSSTFPIEVFKVNNYWHELGITEANRPVSAEKVLGSSSMGRNYLEFDISKTVKNWYEGGLNEGLMLRSSIESLNKIIEFSSKESHLKPELHITYYDTQIYSSGRTELAASLFVQKVDRSDVKASIEVGFVNDTNDKRVNIFVHKIGYPVDNDVPAEIVAVRRNAKTSLTVYKRDASVQNVSMSVMTRGYGEAIASITVSKPIMNSRIIASSYFDRKSALTVKQHKSNLHRADIFATRNNLHAMLDVAHGNLQLAEITIKNNSQDVKETILTVIRSHPPANISVSPRSDKEAFIVVKQNNKVTEKESVLIVSKEKLKATIFVKRYDANHKQLAISVKKYASDQQPSIVTVSRPKLNAELEVKSHNSVLGSLFISFTSDKKTMLDVRKTSNREAFIAVRKTHDTFADLHISRDNILGSITVPFYGHSDIKTELKIKVSRVNDTYVNLIVNGESQNAYYFIM